eukprot:CAMPEP_0185018504 /NCGR_PEP_ID=MMETSP1103-20130426/1208_1 /TAXON_ID=36769 /ORGANISM="Paraphysomonas bandaiensis, Strain Caron Lab Isolate" /LENGTH=284 /DNA_ID=CAMNT_0027548341 /DNA_START=129 /DNA_END=983 /DNA_ORIENTATION=+
MVSLRADILSLLDEHHCDPLFVRLAWHDAGTYDASVGTAKWPKCGGANGSIRFQPEINYGANSGLSIALELLSGLKSKYPTVSWADIIQMASAVAIEHSGGPEIDMKYGRIDVASSEECAPDGNLPVGKSPFPHGTSGATHLRRVFYRMGFGDKEIVVLSGAHTLGRAHKDRSGFGKESTQYTTGDVDPSGRGVVDYGREGGSSWTKNWLEFDNSYFINLMNTVGDQELLKLETDEALVVDDGFRKYVELYAKDLKAFFQDYAAAHKKLSELGARFNPPDGIVI